MEPNNVAITDTLMNMEEPTEEQAEMAGGPSIIEHEIRDMILKRKEASRIWRQAKKEIWDKCWEHYKQHYDKTNKEVWQSTTFIPASPKVAEVIASNMHSATLGPERPAEYQPRRPEFDQPVRDVNDLIAVDMDRSMFKVHWTDLLRTMCIIGTGIGKVEYKKETAYVKIKERNKVNPMMEGFRRMMGMPQAPMETMVEKQVLVKDYACIKNVDPYNIFPEPGSEEICKDNWVIEEGKICNYKLIELANDQDNPLINVTPDLLTNNPAEPEDPDGDEQERDTILDEPVKPTAYLEPDQEHRLDEYWGPAPIWMVKPELYGKEEHKFTMVHAWFWLIDGQHVVRAQMTPFRDAEPPYVKGAYIRVPGQFWGIGPLELIIGLQIELNEVRNTRMDEINIKLSKPIAVVKSMVPKGDWGRLVSGPGALWLFENVDDIKKALMPIEYDANMGDSFRSSFEILNEIQEVTAAVKATVGTGGGEDQAGGDTFRGQLMNHKVASERFMMYARILEKTGLSKAYEKFYQRIYQYKDHNEALAVLGQDRQDFQFIPPEELSKIAKLVPMGVTTVENKGVRLAQMAEQFKMWMGMPWFKPIEHARQMITIGGDDPDLSIMTDEEMQVLNETKRKIIEAASKSGTPVAPPGSPPGPPMNGKGSAPIDPTRMPPMPPKAPMGPGVGNADLTGRPLS